MAPPYSQTQKATNFNNQLDPKRFNRFQTAAKMRLFLSIGDRAREWRGLGFNGFVSNFIISLPVIAEAATRAGSVEGKAKLRNVLRYFL